MAVTGASHGPCHNRAVGVVVLVVIIAVVSLSLTGNKGENDSD